MQKKKILKHKVYKGANTKIVPKQVEAGSAQLVIADPPYNMGKDYEAYYDRLKVDEYLDWTREWVGCVKMALSRQGSFWLFISDGLVSEVDTLCKGEFGFYKRSHIIWYYTFGQNTAKNFTPSHTHVLYYTCTKTKYTFNQDDPDLRHVSARQYKYKDKRADPRGRLPDNTWAIFPELMPEGFDPAGDTWLASRVCGTFHERESHSPNQIPVPLMERIVLASSLPGDLVVDPFCGSGSSGVASKRHGRNYVGCDLSQVCCNQSRKRIANA